MGLPLLVSFLSGFLLRRTGPCAWGRAYLASLLALIVLGALILLVAMDGLICLLMALPLAAVEALAGSALGYALGKRLSAGPAAALPLLLIAAFPFLAAFENHRHSALPLHEVTTTIEISAPLQTVWEQVVAFDRIIKEPDGIFRLGVAYPIEARIDGAGVGAIRHCVFSTGPFVEPITVWEPPHRLEFGVTAQPPPLHEISPWGHISPPHLHDTFVSERGRFRLREKDGRTEVAGTTWYRQAMRPDWYWSRVSDLIIHKIHRRVLDHIRQRAEDETAKAGH